MFCVSCGECGLHRGLTTMRGRLSWKVKAIESPGLKPGDMVGALPRAEARCYSKDRDGAEDQGFSAAGIARWYSRATTGRRMTWW